MSRFIKKDTPIISNQGLRMDSYTLDFLQENYNAISEENKQLLSRNYGFLDRLFRNKDMSKLVKGIKKKRLETDADLTQFALQLAVDAKKELAELQVRDMIRAKSIENKVQLESFTQGELNKYFELMTIKEEEIINLVDKAMKNIDNVSHLPKIKARLEESIYTRLDDLMIFMDKSRKDMLQRIQTLLA